jgi:cysteine synthase A
MATPAKRSFLALTSLVGNTPLLEIRCTFRGIERVIYAKAEHMNFTGSIKDRMAFEILRRSTESGVLKPGDHIVEATSGNTGIAFAAIGRALGHPVTIFMPDWMSDERKNLIRGMGANIRLVSREEGGFLGSIRMAEEMAASNKNVFLPRQFENALNAQAHEASTGREIWWQLQFRGLTPDAFVAGVGTGGTVMGVGKFLRGQRPAIRVHPLEPANSPTLSTGYKVGKHRIQGISDEFIPSIVKLDELDEVIAVDDGDAILMAQKLASELGIGVGISSGANFLGALRVQEKLGPKAVVVTIFADDNKKYLSTDLLRSEPVKDDHWAPKIDLQEFRAFKRVCSTCCDPKECLSCEGTGPNLELQLPHCPRRSLST